ncbi:MAG: UDP-glucuronate 5-epimerase [Ponticaulis sp.]|nr:UDP-glucuronate 5-epimerase [Ponticaulis sp.]|tara:strand:+ start:62 stop:1093 length:1032 start_codon:yes stop_codon:yes gene_type:complete
MDILVTGSAGFIGFHTAKRLLEADHRVIGLDGMTEYYDTRLKKNRHAILAKFDKFTPLIGMLEDKNTIERIVEIAKPEIIIHLAAQAGVRYSLENPEAYVSSNLIGSWNILELAKQCEVKHLLLASTSSVYGANEKIPFEETDKTCEPMTLYAATKKSMEVMAHSYAHLWKIPTTAFRFFTVYGPWGRPDMALFKFVSAILKDQPIDVYGEGKMRRDFTYVDDLVEAMIRLIPIAPDETNRMSDAGVPETLSHNAPFRIVNIGGGQPVGLMPFIETIETAMSVTAKKNMLPMQKGDVPQTYSSPALLKALTGYIPETTLENGVHAFVGWYQNYLKETEEAPVN